MTTPVARLVLRDITLTALSKQPIPVTAQQLAYALAPYWNGDVMEVHKVLRDLEALGLAVRHHGNGALPGGGKTPSLWSSVRSGRATEAAR
jgi:hypothetical protein